MLDRININCINEPLKSSLESMAGSGSSDSENDLSTVGVVFITISVCLFVFALIQLLICWKQPCSSNHPLESEKVRLLG